MKILYFILMILAGLAMIRYCRWIVINTGFRSVSAEKFFGPGGTYTFLKIFGVILTIFAFYYLVKY